MPPRPKPCKRQDIITLIRTLRNVAQRRGNRTNITFQKDLEKVEKCNKRLRDMTDVLSVKLSTTTTRKIDEVVFQEASPMPEDPGPPAGAGAHGGAGSPNTAGFVDGYKPKPRTGAWAILVALERMTANGLVDVFNKDEIIRIAQPDCEETLEANPWWERCKPDPGLKAPGFNSST